MKVLHVNKFHYRKGGSEAVYFDTAHMLEKRGHQSLFFSMEHAENVPCEQSRYFMPFVDLNATRGVGKQLKTAVRILYSFDAKKRLAALLDEHKVDVAHLHNIHHQISPSILHELKRRNIPVVMTLHDYKMVCPSYSLLAHGLLCAACTGGTFYHAIQKRCVKGSLAKSALAAAEMYLHHSMLDIYGLVNVFIAPSLFLKQTLANMGFKKQIVHLPNFIDLAQFAHYSEERSISRRFVYFGRLSAEKGLATLLKAVAGLPQAKLDVIGDGPLRAELEQWTKKHCAERVCFYGHLRGDELWSRIRKAIAVIVPSEWYENNPLTVIEAFALCVPVIGARIGGIPELVRNGETGLTFEAGNVEALTAKLRYAADNTIGMRQMGVQAQTFVQNDLSAEQHYEKLMRIYKTDLDEVIKKQ